VRPGRSRGSTQAQRAGGSCDDSTAATRIEGTAGTWSQCAFFCADSPLTLFPSKNLVQCGRPRQAFGGASCYDCSAGSAPFNTREAPKQNSHLPIRALISSLPRRDYACCDHDGHGLRTFSSVQFSLPRTHTFTYPLCLVLLSFPDRFAAAPRKPKTLSPACRSKRWEISPVSSTCLASTLQVLAGS
jgi:hypothetical protein